MRWQAQTWLAGILLAYLVFLFVVAAVAERAGSRFRRPRQAHDDFTPRCFQFLCSLSDCSLQLFC